MTTALILLIAFVGDAVFGWPARLYRWVGHPVTWLGALITLLERRLNDPARPARTRRLAGVLTALTTIAAAALPAVLVQALLPDGIIGVILAGFLAWPLLAVRSMHDHVQAVARPLLAGDLPAARGAVAMIVGRDPRQLDEAAVGRAALESLAENTSDGIVAPVFWGVLFGLPGIAAYKAINTLDSMIGHRNTRYQAFGWASARIDDVANLIPARLTGLLFAMVSGRPVAGLKGMARDAGKHRSPNAGWPESAMACALNVRLSGPRRYGTHVADEPWLNGTAPDPTPECLAGGLALYRRAMIALAGALALLAMI